MIRATAVFQLLGREQRNVGKGNNFYKVNLDITFIVTAHFPVRFGHMPVVD